jgi:hypothetical protein
MKRWVTLASIQIARCLAAFVAIGWLLGPFGALFSSPLLGERNIAFPARRIRERLVLRDDPQSRPSSEQ